MHRTIALIASLFLLVNVSSSFAQLGTNTNNNGASERAAARRAATAAARGQLEAAQARLKAAEDRIRAEAKANPEQAAAQTELDQAQAELEKIRGPIVERLKNDADYQAAIREEEEAARRLSQEQAKAVAAQPETTQPSTNPANPKPDDGVSVVGDEQSLNVPVPTDAQLVAATDKADIRSRRREMEEKAILADPAGAQVQARIDAATAKLKQYRAELDARLLNDPEYKAAIDALAAARAEVTRAAAGNY